MICSAIWAWELCKIAEILENGCHEMIYLGYCNSKRCRSLEPTEELAQDIRKKPEKPSTTQ